MGQIILQPETTKNVFELMGRAAGYCYGSDISNVEKNIKRGRECFKNKHDRTLEYPQIYVVFKDYSARVMRELYTHIGGAPTRLQSSTRYINYGNFNYVTPKAIEKDKDLKDEYDRAMNNIVLSYCELLSKGVSKEDLGNLLPLGMCTTVFFRTNARQVIDMAHTRLCARALPEFQGLMHDFKSALAAYSPDWEEIVNITFRPKCEILGYCPEKNSCGRMPKK